MDNSKTIKELLEEMKAMFEDINEIKINMKNILELQKKSVRTIKIRKAY